MIKNYAMLGLSSGSGMITITDNDIIEKSNLNRQYVIQFLSLAISDPDLLGFYSVKKTFDLQRLLLRLKRHLR